MMSRDHNLRKRAASEEPLRDDDEAKRASRQRRTEREAAHNFVVNKAMYDFESYSKMLELNGDAEKLPKEMDRLYGDLPPLHPPATCVPLPEYFVDGRLRYNTDEDSRAFYAACATGSLAEVQDFAEQVPRASVGDLQYGLEKAAHAHQLDVVRYLLEDHHVPLHAGVFEGSDAPQPVEPVKKALRGKISVQPKPQPRDIFHPIERADTLHELLAIFIRCGWHPNQSWESARWSPELERMTWAFRHRHSLAIDQEACIANIAITKLLLSHGADPTMGPCMINPTGLLPMFDRQVGTYPTMPGPYKHSPPQRRSTDQLFKLAVRVGTMETIELLVKHGARLASSCLLHTAARRYGVLRSLEDLRRPFQPSRAYEGSAINAKERRRRAALPREEPEARFSFVEDILKLGEDINGLRDVGELLDDLDLTARSGPLKDIFATPLSHAIGYRDWDYVDWLLERGADPDAHDGVAFRTITHSRPAHFYPTRKEEDETGPTMTKLLELLAKHGIETKWDREASDARRAADEARKVREVIEKARIGEPSKPNDIV